MAEEIVSKNEKGTVRIKGIGCAEQTPDLVILSLTLTAQNKEYSAAMKIGSQQIDMLREAIVDAGLKADDLKTVNFNVRSIYEDEEYRDGKITRSRQILAGFECRHDLKISFAFDNKKLNKAIDTIAASLSQPKISITFTIRDAAAFNDEILKSAAQDALRKAETLCAASNVKLGRLININYSESVFQKEIPLCAGYAPPDKTSFNFQPEEIKASDAVEFLWEIE